MESKMPKEPAIICVEYVQKALDHIERISGDDERAHGDEDVLYFNILHAIAHNACEDPEAVCALAITSQDIKFSRWYA